MEISLSKIATIAGIGVAILGACGSLQDNRKAEQARLDAINGIKDEWGQMKTQIGNEWGEMKTSMATEFNGFKESIARTNWIKEHSK